MLARNARPQSGSLQLARLPSSTGRITRLAYARAKHAGIALEPLLKKSSLTRRQIEDPDAPVNVSDQITFLNLVADALDDDLLEFHLAQVADLREVGLVYYVLASSKTLIEALQRGARYCSIVNEGISQTSIDNSSIGMLFQYVGVSRHLDRHQIEFWMAGVVRICRQLTGLSFLPNRVRFSHRGAPNAEFAKIFGDNIQFSATADDITFSNSIRDAPVVGADPHLNQLLNSYCEEAICQRSGRRGSFRSSVENAIVPLLPHGRARADEISCQLGVSQRTLARRLSAEGLTFSELLQDLQCALAHRYLDENDLAISKIAWLLGYREVSAFSHAFKRWTGKPPREVRAS
jgi:AraC-like DNA-binding protein